MKLGISHPFAALAEAPREELLQELVLDVLLAHVARRPDAAPRPVLRHRDGEAAHGPDEVERDARGRAELEEVHVARHPVAS